MQAVWQGDPGGGCPGSRGTPHPAQGELRQCRCCCDRDAGGEDAGGENGRKKAREPGYRRTATPPRVSPHFPPHHIASCPGLQGPGGPHFTQKVSLLGFHGQAFQAGAPHGEHSAHGQASRFLSRTSCWGCGPSQTASAAARRGGVGEGGERQAPGQLSWP